MHTECSLGQLEGLPHTTIVHVMKAYKQLTYMQIQHEENLDMPYKVMAH